MSRGLGRVQRTILRTMQAAPDQAFTAKQLCGAVYRVTVKRNRRVVLRAGIQFAERAMVDSAMLYVRYLRNWRGRDRGLVFFNAANFASCRQAKEIVDFGYSESAVASDLEIFAAERAGNAKRVAKLEAKREAAINAYMASMLVGRKSSHVLPVQPLDQVGVGEAAAAKRA
jgi:hypothetical protein